MAQKQTYSRPSVFEFVGSETTKQIASSGVEVSSLKLIASASAAVVSLYDTSGTNPQSTDKKWVLDASTSDNDVQNFSNPLGFKKGIYAVLEQGANSNAKLCIAMIPSEV